jgi:hypothetical protein
MKKKLTRLTVVTLNALNTEGLYRDPDSTGLYIQVTHKRKGTERRADNGITRSWVYRYRSPITGKDRAMGLGSCSPDSVWIAQARADAKWARNIVQHGDDPIEVRKTEQDRKIQAGLREQASRMTFRQCIDQAVPGMVANSRNEKHQRQFKDSLLKACTAFGDVSVAAIDSQMIVQFLTPICKRHANKR